MIFRKVVPCFAWGRSTVHFGAFSYIQSFSVRGNSLLQKISLHLFHPPREIVMAEFTNQLKIVVIAKIDDDTLRELSHLPPSAKVTSIGSCMEDFSGEKEQACLAEADVVLNCIGEASLISQLWPSLKRLRWMHSRFAGVDHLLFPELVESSVLLTNARGLFSSSLAEYCMLGCLFFAKNVRRLNSQQRNQHWEKFVVSELRGSTMGIIGYGDIGKACARLAKAFGMRVLAQRRRPQLCEGDELVDEVFGPGQIELLMSQSDYILLTAALTPETRHLVSDAELAAAKPGSILINLGRGPLIDEQALIKALRGSASIAGAVLDVFETEPLPATSPLWQLENVLLSPHNADMTADFLHQSVRHFAQSIDKFLKNEPLGLHIVDKMAGY